MVKTVSQKLKQLSTAIANSLNDSVSLPGLVYVEEHNDLPGFTRKSSGKNFVYLECRWNGHSGRGDRHSDQSTSDSACLDQSLDLPGHQRSPAGNRSGYQGKKA